MYIPQKTVKGQALTDFLTDHPIPNDRELSDELHDENPMLIEVQPLCKCSLMGMHICLRGVHHFAKKDFTILFYFEISPIMSLNTKH